MSRQPNPYRPGFNQAPHVLVGRDVVLASATEALAVAALDARTPRPVLLVGPRGVGKTVALAEIANRALEQHSWPTVHVEVRPRTPFTPDLVERVQIATTLLEGATATRRRRLRVSGGKVKAEPFGVGAEVDIVKTEDPSPAVPLERALVRCMEAAVDRKAGLVLTIDELQLADRRELADLAAVLQAHIPDAWPVVLIAAGLPTLREPTKSVTYLERAEWHELGLLSEPDSIDALRQPAQEAGRPMSAAAAHELAAAAGGYPYAVQVMGHHAWRASTGASRITRTHVRTAMPAAQADLAAGLYASRWDDASPRERDYLTALANLTTTAPAGVEVTGVDVAKRLGEGTREVSYLRDRLLKKGTLFTRGRVLQFVTPGMGEWIRDHATKN